MDASRLAIAAIEEGVKQAVEGQLDGLVTAPVNKLGFKRAGLDVPGHTELLAGLTGSSRYGMMLVGGGLRVMLATRHLPLKEVPSAISKAVVREAVELAYEGLDWLGVSPKSIGVCGLNPHAGDGGAIGKEESAILNPVALRALAKKGIPVSMALPADTLFHEALRESIRRWWLCIMIKDWHP